MKLSLLAGGLLALTGLTAASLPQQARAADYPARDIRMVVPWGAGGGTDGIVRKLSSLAEKELGGTIYVENVEGGISATGVAQVMSARPDGYTLGALTYDSVVTIPWQDMLPTYRLDKLKLIARLTSEPDAIVASTRSGYGSIEEVLAAAKDTPGQVRVAIQNLGGRVHLALLQLQKATGTEFKMVSYPGGAAPQKEALLSNEAQVALTSLGDFSNLIADGSVKGLMEFSDTHNPTYPEVPTATDAGIDVQIGSFIVIAAPAGTPDEIVAKVEAAYHAALDSEAFQSWVKEVGVTPSWLGSEAVTGWATETQTGLFAEMDKLVAEGVLKK